jgi:Holliday junction resolvase RusA-like endonuclease
MAKTKAKPKSKVRVLGCDGCDERVIVAVFPLPPTDNMRNGHTRSGHTYHTKEYQQAETIVKLAWNNVSDRISPFLEEYLACLLVIVRPNERSDAHNYRKTILDMLQGTVFANDRQIVLTSEVGIDINPDDPLFMIVLTPLTGDYMKRLVDAGKLAMGLKLGFGLVVDDGKGDVADEQQKQ